MAKRRNRRKECFLIGRQRRPIRSLFGKEAMQPCVYELTSGPCESDFSFHKTIEPMYRDEVIEAHERLPALQIYRLQPMKLVDGKLVPDEGE